MQAWAGSVSVSSALTLACNQGAMHVAWALSKKQLTLVVDLSRLQRLCLGCSTPNKLHKETDKLFTVDTQNCPNFVRKVNE